MCLLLVSGLGDVQKAARQVQVALFAPLKLNSVNGCLYLVLQIDNSGTSTASESYRLTELNSNVALDTK